MDDNPEIKKEPTNIENNSSNPYPNYLSVLHGEYLIPDLEPIIKTKNLDQNAIAKIDEKTNVLIQKANLVPGGFFSKNYINFELKTLPQKWIVTRTDDHFERLRTQLARMYPACIIPFLKFGKNTKDNAFIPMNQTIAQNFITEIVNHPILRTSNEVELFLSTFSDDFESLFKNYEKQLPPLSIDEQKNCNGKLELKLNKEFPLECQNINEEISEICKTNKSIIQINQKIIETCKNLSNLYKEHSDQYRVLSQIFYKLKHNEMTKFVNQQSKLSIELSKNYLEESELLKEINTNMNELIMQDSEVISELCKKWKEKNDSFYSSFNDLKQRKEQIFEAKDIKKWETDISSIPGGFKEVMGNKNIAFKYILPQASSEVFQIKKTFLFYSHYLLTEFDRSWNTKVENLKDFLINLSIKSSQHYANINQIWADLNTILAEIPEQKEFDNKIIEDAYKKLPPNKFN